MAGFNIPLGADTTPLERDMAKASQITQRSSELMAQSIGVVDAKQKLLNQTLAVQLANVQKLSLKYGENSAEALKMASAAERTRMQLAQMVQPANNIGNVAQKSAGQFNSLGNSVNQLSRELPAFANSAQTGFMAISNNLPIFFDAINGIKRQNAELVASGQPAVSVMGALGSAIFSWGTAISLGITALTVFGPQLAQLTKELFTTADAYDESARNGEIFTSVLNKQNEDIQQGNQDLRERIKLLGIELAAAQGGISVKQATIAYEENRLRNMQRILQQMQSETETFEVNGIKVMAGKYASMIEPYTKRIELQKQRIELLQKELGLETKINETVIPNKAIQSPFEIESRAANGLGSASTQVAYKIQKNLQDALDRNTLKLSPKIDISNAWIDPAKQQMQDAIANLNQAIKSSFSALITNISQQLGEALVGIAQGNFKNPFDAIGQVILSSIGTLMQSLGSAMITVGVALSKFQVSLATLNPFAVIAAGALLVGAGAAVTSIAKAGMQRNSNSGGGGGSSSGSQRQYGWQQSNLPMMAEGGLLYGKTAFIGGEYAGASTNPEVVAPLNKLKSIIGGSGGGMLSADLSGRTIKFALVRENKYRSQNFGR